MARDPLRVALDPTHPGEWLATIGLWRIVGLAHPAATLHWEPRTPADPIDAGERVAVIDLHRPAPTEPFGVVPEADAVIRAITEAVGHSELDATFDLEAWSLPVDPGPDAQRQSTPWLARPGRATPEATAAKARTEATGLDQLRWVETPTRFRATDAPGWRHARDGEDLPGWWSILLAGHWRDLPSSDACKGAMFDDRWRSQPKAYGSGADPVDIPIGLTWLCFQALPLLGPVTVVDGKVLSPGWVDRQHVCAPTWARPLDPAAWPDLWWHARFATPTWVWFARSPRLGEAHSGALTPDRHQHQPPQPQGSGDPLADHGGLINAAAAWKAAGRALAACIDQARCDGDTWADLTRALEVDTAAAARTLRAGLPDPAAEPSAAGSHDPLGPGHADDADSAPPMAPIEPEPGEPQQQPGEASGEQPLGHISEPGLEAPQGEVAADLDDERLPPTPAHSAPDGEPGQRPAELEQPDVKQAPLASEPGAGAPVADTDPLSASLEAEPGLAEEPDAAVGPAEPVGGELDPEEWMEPLLTAAGLDPGADWARDWRPEIEDNDG